MNQGISDGAERTTGGQAEEIAGRAFTDKQPTARSFYDEAAGSMQSAYGHAKDAIATSATEVAKDASATYAEFKDTASQGAKTAIDGLANNHFDAMRDDLAKLG